METSSTTSIRLRNSRSLAPPSETPAIASSHPRRARDRGPHKLDATRLVEVRERRQDLPNTDLGPKVRTRPPGMCAAQVRHRRVTCRLAERGSLAYVTAQKLEASRSGGLFCWAHHRLGTPDQPIHPASSPGVCQDVSGRASGRGVSELNAQRTTSPSAAYLSTWAWPLCSAYSSIIFIRATPSGHPWPWPSDSSDGRSAIARSAFSTSTR